MMTNRNTLLRFGVVGVVVAALYIGLYLTFQAAGMARMPANALAFLIAVCVQYLGQAWFSFARPIADTRQFGRFVLMIIAGLLMASLVTGIIAPALAVPDWAAAVAVTVILPIQNYLFMALWVFSDPKLQTEHS